MLFDSIFGIKGDCEPAVGGLALTKERIPLAPLSIPFKEMGILFSFAFTKGVADGHLSIACEK